LDGAASTFPVNRPLRVAEATRGRLSTHSKLKLDFARRQAKDSPARAMLHERNGAPAVVALDDARARPRPNQASLQKLPKIYSRPA